MPGLGVYEDDLAEVKMDQVLVFRGSFEDAAKVVYELLMSNAKNHPDFHVEKAPLKTLASIIADATLPWEIVEAAKFLSEIIEPTSACVALEHTRDSYRFMFRDPLPVGRNTKAEGSFAVLRRPDGYYDASSFHKVQASEIFYCPHYRPLIRTVLNDLRELLRR